MASLIAFVLFASKYHPPNVCPALVTVGIFVEYFTPSSYVTSLVLPSPRTYATSTVFLVQCAYKV